MLKKVNKCLIIVYTIKLKKYKTDRGHGFVRSNVGIIMSILFSLFVNISVILR